MMKIEYLADGAPECPLIRVYGEDSKAISALYNALRQMSDGAIDEIVLPRMPAFEPIAGCSLVMRVGNSDDGVRKPASGLIFNCVFSRETWDKVAGLVEPFTRAMKGRRHQWLCGKEAISGLTDSEVAILLSHSSDGRW